MNISGDKLKKYRIFLLITVMLTVAATVISSYLYLTQYEFDTMNYYVKTPLSVAFPYAVLISAILFLIFGSFFKKEEITALPTRNTFNIVSSTVTAFGFLMLFVFSFMGMSRKESTLSPETALGRIAVYLSVIAAIYFLMKLFARNNSITKWLGLVVIAWGILQILEQYYTKKFPINSQPNNFLMVSLLSIILYTVKELKFNLGPQKTGWYISVSFIAFFLCSLSSVPYILKFVIDRTYTTQNTVISVAVFGFGLYVLSILLSLAKDEKK